jgi:PQQ-dependent dehydrogenase (methanol/ethanol family)
MIRYFLAARPSAVFAVVLCTHVCPALTQAQPLGGVRTPVVRDSVVDQPPQFGPNCAVCHGGDALGTDRAPALTNNRRLRAGSETDIADTIKKGQGNMPSFNFLPPAQIQALAHYVHSLNADAFDTKPAGDATAGASIFFGSGHCSDCHTAQGRGGANGPDLSRIGRLLTVAELNQSIEDPAARVSTGYGTVDVTLRDGSVLRGFARNRTAHSIDLQTLDGRLHLLLDADYSKVLPDNPIASGSATPMPPFGGTADQRRDLIAFLSTLGGVAVGPNLTVHESVSPEAANAVLHPRAGDWPTYAGNVNGNRYSPLTNINVKNVSALRPAWVHPIPYNDLETTPLVLDGVMYVTGPNQVYALDGRTGSEIWSYTWPRSSAAEISGDAAKGATRGVAILGERLFFITDNAHLICLQTLTGALLWDVSMPGQPGKYGGTSAPLIAGNLVIAGVSGGDEGVRGFVAAYQPATGEETWRFWTVPTAGEPAAESWRGDTDPQGGTTWTTPSYDGDTGVLYVATGNPYPDTDGDHRGGDNLYTDSDLALDAKTGRLLWSFQFTPHDVHDWDANQPIALVDTRFHGQIRRLLLHANRNGFFYVLDRTTGQLLQASALVKKLTWASGIGADGRPILLPGNEPTLGGVTTCPAVRGATNWYSTAFNPSTQLYYVMTVEDCSTYRKAHDGGYGFLNNPDDPPMKVLRAMSVETGKVAWELPLMGHPERNYSGVLSTAGGLLFFGETSGGFAAVDAKDGHYLWHFEADQPWKASPMTYLVNGRQYIAIASGPNILSFALADH